MMKFKVVGTNVKTSARMVIEVEAQNRAAAERAASAAGMEVLHVEQVPDDPLGGALHGTQRPSQRGEHAEPSRRVMSWIVVLVVAVVVAIGMIWWMRT